MPHVIVGTAGHIDHGKTALVRALTGIDTDRLKEEKERGITIDIGFANLALDDGTTLGFVDVPGHERFIKNMLAGVGGIDLVMLVIAADESVMPQTREHLDICSLLHVKQGLTVLTKIDSADRELIDIAEIEAQELLQGTFLEHSPILRVSSRSGEGIPRLVETLRELAGNVEPKDASQIFRLPIDRSFTMKGFGTVVSGTLIAGRVRREDEVEILPSQHITRVRGIQVHGVQVDEARAGQRTALNLQRVELHDLERGMVLAPPHVFRPTMMFDVHLDLLPSAPSPIVRRKRIRFHIGTAEVIGHVVLLGQDTLEPGESTFAQVRLERPTFALPGDRFIVRQYSPMTTLGGGEILDSRPGRHRRADRSVCQRLDVFRQASSESRVRMIVEQAGIRTLDLAEIIARTGVRDDAVRGHLRALADAGQLRILSDTPLVVVSADVFGRAMAALVKEVERFHQTDPLLDGIAREDLKGRALRDAPALLFRSAVDALVAEGRLAVDQEIVRLHGRTVNLGPGEARIREQLRERFRTLGLAAPSADDVMADLELDRQVGRRILQLMVKEHALVKLAENILVDSEALRQLIVDVRALKARGSTFGVKEFKELTGLSRKFAVPLLEHLDAQRVTRRVGDERVIL
jgi:selenocysteine-specific elongation factor